MKFGIALLVFTLAASVATAGNIPGATIVSPGTPSSAWLPPAGYSFAGQNMSLDLTATGSPVTLSGTIDLSQTPDPASGSWSHYYAWLTIKDKNNQTLNTTFATDWLGTWRGIPAQPWDRIRMELGRGPIIAGPELYFSADGGQTDDGGGVIVASDRIYDFEMIVDPALKSLSLRLSGHGRTSSAADEWYNVGTMDLSSYSFDFEHTALYAQVWSDGPNAQVTLSNMNLSPMAPAVPEATTVTLAITGAASLFALRRRRS